MWINIIIVNVGYFGESTAFQNKILRSAQACLFMRRFKLARILFLHEIRLADFEM